MVAGVLGEEVESGPRVADAEQALAVAREAYSTDGATGYIGDRAADQCEPRDSFGAAASRIHLKGPRQGQ